MPRPGNSALSTVTLPDIGRFTPGGGPPTSRKVPTIIAFAGGLPVSGAAERSPPVHPPMTASVMGTPAQARSLTSVGRYAQPIWLPVEVAEIPELPGRQSREIRVRHTDPSEPDWRIPDGFLQLERVSVANLGQAE